MNSKQLAQRLNKKITERSGSRIYKDENLEAILDDFAYDATHSERVRILSELKKLDVSKYTAMSLMVEVIDIVGGEE